LWDAATGRGGVPLLNERNIAACLAYSPDGAILATGHVDQSIRPWDAATGRLIRRLNGHQQAVRSLAFSPDGRTLASGAGDATTLGWDLAGATGPAAAGEPPPGTGR